MRLLNPTEQGDEPGMLITVTPLQARLLASPRSPEWELCDEWDLLHRGRGALDQSDPDDWFDMEDLARIPPGLTAELYASSGKWDKVLAALRGNQDACHYILALPNYVTDATSSQREAIHKVVEMARGEDARRAQSAR